MITTTATVHALGYLLLAAPFVAIAIFAVKQLGWSGLAFTFGTATLITGMIAAGVYLSEYSPPDTHRASTNAVEIWIAERVAEYTAAEPTNGQTVLLFPEWTNSSSAFERHVYTWYYGVYSNGHWVTYERQPDGSLLKFWKNDSPDTTIEDAKLSFGVNMSWNISRAMYDALSPTNQ